MRDWRLIRRQGIDVASLAASGRYRFIDCLEHASSLVDFEKRIQAAVAEVSSTGARNVHLVVDNPDVLLALPLANAQQLNATLLKLRATVHSVVVSSFADLPLLAAATSNASNVPTPLEAEGAAFLVQQSHNAAIVLSARGLETGAAHDVSGVLRATRRGGAYAWSDEAWYQGLREAELLCAVQRDGNVDVYERGATQS